MESRHEMHEQSPVYGGVLYDTVKEDHCHRSEEEQSHCLHSHVSNPT